MSKCICATCGTMEEDPITGYCINDHDDWLESRDDIELFMRASKNLNVPIEELYQKLMEE